MKNANAEMEKNCFDSNQEYEGSKIDRQPVFQQGVTGDLLSTTKTNQSSQHGHEFMRLNVIGDCPKKILFHKLAAFTSVIYKNIICKELLIEILKLVWNPDPAPVAVARTCVTHGQKFS